MAPRLTRSRQSDVLELWSDRVINLPEEGQNVKVQDTEIAVEEAGDYAGALAATHNAEARNKKSDVVTIPTKTALAITSAAETDLISDLVLEIESLEKQDAIARLIELDDTHEQTYFEIGSLANPRECAGRNASRELRSLPSAGVTRLQRYYEPQSS